MKCDACLTGAAVSTGIQFSVITGPGRRVVAHLDLCEICQACSQHVTDAIVRKGAAWTISSRWEEERKPVTAPAPPPKPRTASPDDVSVARASGYTGDVCGNCGSLRMVRAGTCEMCQDCHLPSRGCS